MRFTIKALQFCLLWKGWNEIFIHQKFVFVFILCSLKPPYLFSIELNSSIIFEIVNVTVIWHENDNTEQNMYVINSQNVMINVMKFPSYI